LEHKSKRKGRWGPRRCKVVEIIPFLLTKTLLVLSKNVSGCPRSFSKWFEKLGFCLLSFLLVRQVVSGLLAG